MKFFKQSLSAWALAAALFAGATSSANAQTIIWGAGSSDPAIDSIGRFANAAADTVIANTGWTPTAVSDPVYGMWAISFTGDSRGTNSLTITTRQPLTSPSLADGAAMFDSDFYYVASNASAPQAGHITSPIIDLTGYTDSSLAISMHTAYLDFATTSSVIGFSKDGGTTWREVDVRTLAGPSGTRATFNGVVAMYIGTDLAGATDLDSCMIRLRFDGDSYYWAADDINIRTTPPPPPFDLTISQTTAGNTLGDAFTVGYVSNNFYQPISQVSSDDYFFGARVLNNGVAAILPANNAKLMVMVDFETAPNVWTNEVMDSLAIDSLLAGARETFTDSFANNWLPTQVGRYRTTYYVKHDLADASTVGDTSRHFFNITDSTGYYSKVPLATDGGVLSSRAGFPVASGTNRVSGFEWGNMYYFPTGASYKVDSISFRAYIQNAAAGYTGGQIAVRISKFNDINGDGVLDDAAPNPELQLVGLGTVDFTSVTNGFKRGSATIIDLNGDPLILQDTSIYLVSLAQDVATGLETATGTFTGYWYGSNEDYNYGINAAVLSAIPSPMRVAEMTAAGAPAVNDWNWIGFGPDIIPAIGINLSPSIVGTERIIANANHNLSVFPNPTNDVLNVKIDLTAQSNVQYLITDVTGRVVRTSVSRNVQNEVVAFNVADLAAGVYMVTVKTNQGASTERFVKQ
jgi:hypothetical protein